MDHIEPLLGQQPWRMGCTGGVAEKAVGVEFVVAEELEQCAVELIRPALGCDVEIETFDGERKVSVEPGAQHGDVILLRGLGATRLRSRGRGDLRLEIKVLTPSRLDSKQRKLLGELRGMFKNDGPRLGSRRARGRF